MNLSTLTSSHTQRPLLLPSPFHSRRRRFRVSLPRCSSDTASSPPSAPPPQQHRPPKDLKGIEVLVDKLSPPARLAASAIVVAGAVAAGYGLGSRFGGNRYAALGGAVALGAAGGAAAYALNASAPQVAAVNLHNYVAAFDDPSKLKKEEIDAIASKLASVSNNDRSFFVW